MPKVLSLVVKGKAQPKGSTQARGHYRGFDPVKQKHIVTTSTRSANPNLKDWELEIRVHLQRWLVEHPQFKPIGHDAERAERRPPVAVTTMFYLRPPNSDPRRPWPVVAPDLDKLVRGCLDPFSKRLYMDDSQVCNISTWKVCSDVDEMHLVIWTPDGPPNLAFMERNPFSQLDLFRQGRT